MSLQVSRCLPRNMASSSEAGSWMTAADLVRLILAAKENAEQLYNSQGATAAACRTLHDAVLACMLFGYLPPVRLSCIRTMTHPKYHGPCLHPDCNNEACRGNRLIVRSRSPLQLCMDLPHHKNVSSWGYKAINITVPSGLAELLYKYIGLPHQVLTQHLPEACPFVFVNRGGQGFEDSQLCTYWSAWLTAQGGSAMPPSKLRQVFVGERRSNARVAGPTDAGAARVMGHSPDQWTKWYDVHFHNRETQNAVDAMSAWRQELMQHDPTQPGTSASHAAAMSAPSSDAEQDDVVIEL